MVHVTNRPDIAMRLVALEFLLGHGLLSVLSAFAKIRGPAAVKHATGPRS
jgi:hypothetical protein